MAPLVVNSASSVFSFNQTVTFSAFDCSGTDTLLLVQIESSRAAALPFQTPTFNGVALTLYDALGPLGGGGVGDHRIWYMIGPTGAHDVICSLAVAGTRGTCGVVLLTGVNQTSPFGTKAQTFANLVTTFTEGAVASAADQLVLDFVANNNTSPTKDASQTLIYQTAVDSDCQGEASWKVGSASTVMQWTSGSAEYFGADAIPILPTGGGGGPTTGSFTGLLIGAGR